jgi:hypothetical protein
MNSFKRLGIGVVVVGCTLSFFHSKVTASEVAQVSQVTPSPLAPDAVKIGSDGSWAVQQGVGNTVVMPTRDVVEPGGIITLREGFKVQILYEAGKPVGYQLFTLNGTKLNPGEGLKFPDGTTLVQPRF